MSDKMIKVEFTYEREDGSRYRRSIEGEQALEWKRLTDDVCVIAQIHGHGPKWQAIDWLQTELQ